MESNDGFVDLADIISASDSGMTFLLNLLGESSNASLFGLDTL
jgi:hypothetical protein